MDTIPISESVDLDTMRSRIKELGDIHGNSNDVSELSPSDSENLLKDCALQIESKIKQILSEFSDIGSLPVEDLDAYLGHLNEEFNSMEAENAKISNEIECLTRKYIEDSSQLEGELEELNCSLDIIALRATGKAKADEHVDSSLHGEEMEFLNQKGDYKFKMLELNHQIQQNKLTLESLQNLAGILKRFEAIEKIEDALTGLKVIECEGNYIRLSLRTCPNSESLFSQHKIEDITEPLELNHELLIEVVEGTLELKGVEIFPNDVYIGEIIDAAKSFRKLFPNMSMLDARSSLEWFVRQVQDRIVLCSMRRLLVKYANKSRHSFEYLDRDDIVVAHKVGGVDAYIKMSHGWPVSNHALKLISLKSSGHSSKEISLSFLCKVEEEANSLDADTRQNISSFVDAIEEILMQRMRAELQYEKNSEK
ncbi:uncharacterized protein LOC130773497 [Actinidia eriantha]|uniref:uncharacterized protein LOC130773497 n=1 Tax=Actinidia eriantha TaxID=165200 RepID=UPI002582825B|nr:uncharacterized protein LOC130773497 [Actinidia eriantha]